MNTIIREMRPEEHNLLREFLYQAIYVPEGVEPPPRSVVDLPELQVYLADFGTRPGDHGLVAEVEKKVIGAAWCRMMEDYGHIDNDTPSLAISLLPEYRGQGTGTQLLNGLLRLLWENGYRQASLSVQKENPALRLYQRTGFRIVAERGTEYLMLWDGTQGGQQENMNMDAEKQRESKIRQWFSMWLDKRDTGIEELFTQDAVYIESWGPEYRGSGKIKLWFDEWNSRGTVERWNIRQYFHRGNQTVVEWAFRCVMADGTVQSFDGLSLIRWNEAGQICFLQEFGCNENRYDPYAQGNAPVFREEQALWF
ncbi:hypothetical protein B5G43_00955 [Flavonifractor sp. An92]|nr:hypothetical protein B5G43_00955 [Flavonifractor sp. An92]OUQ26436.1 hypothetical protein B5E80_02290 [Flavonifractor sp. An135]